MVAPERAALRSLYDATRGAGWRNSTNWNTSAPLGEWYGVTTDAAGRVTELDLNRNGLAGPIPAGLQGLEDLEALNLGGNTLTGPIPGALASLVNLEELYLWGNQLTGPVPSWLGNMTRLRRLNLGGNAFSSGPIPRELARLVNLEQLYLWGNQLTGPIPSWLGGMTRLRWLDLGINAFSSGPIPGALASLVNLEELYLIETNRTGPIPAWLGNLRNLSRLSLSENELTGPIPGALGSLGNLSWLSLSRNALTGTIPGALASLLNLEELFLWRNQLTGTIPVWLGNLASLRRLSLSENELTGGIPPELGNLADLKYLWLYENPLTGSVPESLTQLSLDLFWIQSTGVCVPAEFRAWVATIGDFRGSTCSVNRPPEPVGRLAPVTVGVDESSVTVDVSGAFRDPDGDRLTYGASSSAPSVASVGVSGSRVSVTPVSEGTASVAVTATDIGGSNRPARQTFTVTVTPRANRPPEAVGTLSAVRLRVDESSVTVDVSGAFRDPDGDRLTYGASSSAPSVASVGVSGSRVSVTPVSEGTASVAVTATDIGGSNRPARQTFTVTVTPRANRPPEAVGTLSAVRLRVDESSVTVDVSGAFRDPDGDRLTYGASSSAPSVASVGVSGSRVSVTPVSEGTASVAVTATDIGGSNRPARQTFTVTVTPRANRPPEAVGTLSAVRLRVDESSVTVDVSGAFRDPDGDRLTYGASSSAPSVASVGVSGSRVSVTPVSEGTASVAVTATDIGGSNRPARQTFTVTVTPRANRPPEAVGTLSAVRLRVDESSVTVDVSGAFRDPDGDRLTYGATSSVLHVVAARATGARVTLTAVSVGTATVEVTATDPDGLSAAQSFRVRVTAPFTDDPLVPGETPVKVVHFTELRARIDVLRGEAGLAPFRWTDPVLRARATPVKLAHLLELRSALAEAYGAAGRPAPRWTDASPAAGTTPIRALHLTELRAAVLALE